MEFLEFIFSSGWRWLGAFLMLSVICAALANISFVNIEYHTDKEIKKEDKDETTKLKRM